MISDVCVGLLPPLDIWSKDRVVTGPATDLCPDADNTRAPSELGGNTPELQGKSEP